VALFGCYTTDLANQYPGTIFTGSTPDIWFDALEEGGAAFTETLVQGGTIDQTAVSAQNGMKNTTDKINKEPENKNDQAVQPKVCTTAGGNETCH